MVPLYAILVQSFILNFEFFLQMHCTVHYKIELVLRGVQQKADSAKIHMLGARTWLLHEPPLLETKRMSVDCEDYFG